MSATTIISCYVSMCSGGLTAMATSKVTLADMGFD